MPELDISDHPASADLVLAVMTFPDDAQMRSSLQAVNWAERELRNRKDIGFVEVMNDLFEQLLDSPSKNEMKVKVGEATKRGFVAGECLAMVYAMNSFPEDFNEPSTRKAIPMMQAWAKQTPWGDGSRMPASETEIRSCLHDYKSVAHLWAAYRLHSAFPIRPNREVFGSYESLCDFLAIAGTLQDFGTTFISKRARPAVPMLDDRSIWRVPDGRRLIPPWTEAPEFLLNLAKTYKSRNASR